MSAHRPLVGFGPETYGTEFLRFESIQLASVYPDFYHESPHNIFLDALTSQGFLGLLALLGLCALGAWSAAACLSYGAMLWVRPWPPPLWVFLSHAAVHRFRFHHQALYFHLLVALLVVTAWSPWKPAPIGQSRPPLC